MLLASNMPVTEETVEPVISIGELANKLKVHRGTILRWIKTGAIPPPIKITARSFCWRVSVINNWQREKEAKSA